MSKKQAAASGSLKDLERRRTEVIKPILDNPFTSGFEWPNVDPATSDKILGYLTQLLSRYGNYLDMKRDSHGKNVPVPPEALKITVGFNSTVKRLEDQAAPNRERILGKKKHKKNKKSKTKGTANEELSKTNEDSANTDENLFESKKTPFVGYVFVARADITSPLLTDCFPQLTFSASSSLTKRVHLIQLPRGATNCLSKVLHTENASIISLCDDWSDASPLFSLIDKSVNFPNVPWLEQIFSPNASMYHSLNISLVKTEAPIGKPKKTETQMLKEQKSIENSENLAGNGGSTNSKKRKGEQNQGESKKRSKNSNPSISD